jgi:hypothetical protein
MPSTLGIVSSHYVELPPPPFTGTTVLRLSGEGTNGAQNNTFLDSSSTPKTITRNGSVTQGSFSPFPLNGAVYNPTVHGGSAYFNGSSYLDVGTPILNTTGNFTIECWIYVTGGSGTYRNILGQYILSNPNRTNFSITAANRLSWSTIGSASQLLSLNTIPQNTWTHVCIVRNGSGTNNVSMYVDGAIQGSYTDTGNFAQTNTWIGQGQTASAGAFIGYISNFRITNSAVYPSAFVPPTAPLTNVANTSLLLNFTNGGVIDSVAKNDIVTAGNAQISTAVKKNGNSSIYFDGTGDYLKIPHSNDFVFGSKDFMIATWVYNVNISGAYRTIFSKRLSTSEHRGIVLGLSSGTYKAYAPFTGSSWVSFDGGPAKANAWEHIALIRQGSTFNFYVNGRLRSTTTQSGAIVDSTTASVTIGADSDATAFYTNCYLDDFIIKTNP